MTYEPTPTFWLAPTGQAATGMLLSASPEVDAQVRDCAHGHHHVIVFTGCQTEDGLTAASVPSPEPGGPQACECGYVFTADDDRYEWRREIYERPGTGQLYLLHFPIFPVVPKMPYLAAPPGAMWDAHWMGEDWQGPDGMSLTVRLPNGHDWSVDSRARNCTLPGDREHRCWVRHGDPRTEPVTVDKNGLTCTAGAGSILSGDYHGFLRNGILTSS